MSIQIGILILLTISCITWTITQEELFRELREWFGRQTKNHASPFIIRKFAYMPTCEYCSSHYITFGILFLYDFTWTEILIYLFPFVWMANWMMSLYKLLRQTIKRVGNV